MSCYLLPKWTYHVVTPFSRVQNLRRQLEMMTRFGVEWDLLIDANSRMKRSLPNWVRIFSFQPQQPFWRAWAHHLNQYISTVPIIPDDRYCILNDDDFYEPGFFSKLDQHNGDVLICSMMRGQHVPLESGPLRSHPTDTLIACAENMKVGRVGCEQMICSGKVFSTLHFVDDPCADGMAIVDASKRYPVEYVPDANVWFNYLEPGRWTQRP